MQRWSGSYDPERVCLPLTVLNLMVLSPLVTIQLGSCLVCMDRVDPIGMAEWIRDLAKYEVPEVWRFVDDFPRTPMGKIRKTELRALLA